MASSKVTNGTRGLPSAINPLLLTVYPICLELFLWDSSDICRLDSRVDRNKRIDKDDEVGDEANRLSCVNIHLTELHFPSFCVATLGKSNSASIFIGSYTPLTLCRNGSMIMVDGNLDELF